MISIALIGAAAINVAIIRDDAVASGVAIAASTPAASTSAASGESSTQERVVRWSLGHGYSRSDEHILFEGVRIDEAGRGSLEGFQAALGRRVVLANDVHAASFAALSSEYAKDRSAVYYRWVSPGRFWVVEIPNADPATFEVMDCNLAKDAHRVYRTDVPIEGADAATAQVVNADWVWKDRHRVYYQFTPLVGADPKSFRHLNQAFYRDAHHIYWSTTRLDGADVNTFRTFGNEVPYAVDGRQVWFGDRRILQVDAKSFRLLHNHVFADSKGVYVGGRALQVVDADPSTFEKVTELVALDCVLFRDRARRYIFDPHYAEVYALTTMRDGVAITKPVWFAEAGGAVRLAATVSATWRDGALSEPVVELQPGRAGEQVPAWEAGKLQRMTDPIREALGLSGGDPVAATAEDDGSGRDLRVPGGDR